MEMKNLDSVPWIRHPDRSRRFGGEVEGPAFPPRAHSLNHADQMFFDRAKSKDLLFAGIAEQGVPHPIAGLWR